MTMKTRTKMNMMICRTQMIKRKKRKKKTKNKIKMKKRMKNIVKIITHRRHSIRSKKKTTRRKKAKIMKSRFRHLSIKFMIVKRSQSRIIQTTRILTKQIPKHQVKITKQHPNWKR